MVNTARERREFLRFLTGSALSVPSLRAQASQALSVADFEVSAHNSLPPAHWGYLATGVDDDLTLKANISAFQKIALRPRRLVDVSKTDTRVEIFGQTWDSPLFLCPVGAQKAFHPEGEAAVARAARAKRVTQVLSTVTSVSVEKVTQELGRAPWFQLYMPAAWENTEKLVRRVEAAGCPVLVWTIDLFGGRNSETLSRLMRTDKRECGSCHPAGPALVVAGLPPARETPMLDGIGGNVNPPFATWAFVERLKKLTTMKVVLKGIDNADDARLARESGADGVVVSNHGGWATETLRSTIDCLPEVVDAVKGMPVLIDGGFRRGSDIYKALALGAKAVGVGRPYIYGLASQGQAGVERVIDILRGELEMTMRQCGTPAVSGIGRGAVIRPGSA